ncbi:MAG: glycoside hydrolase family 125 protein [Prevotella sp.]|nr:glycoside hydrolase family 125 protein [Prevotella sp.]
MKKSLLVMCCLLSMTVAAQENAEVAVSNRYTTVVPDNTKVFESKRPPMAERLFVSDAVEAKISEVQQLLSGNPRLAWMFANCFPNTLESTVHYRLVDGEDDTFVYTGDIPAMWLRDSGAQVWPYVQLAANDPKLKKMLRGVILRQFKCINIDRYANAFNDGPTGAGWQSDVTKMQKDVFERKYEIDSLCYPVRLAYWYWLVTGDASIFGEVWLQAAENIVKTFREQQRKENLGPYCFFRMTDRTYDTVGWNGYGAPVKPVGLIASVFRPSDDRTSLPFLVPSNFMAVSSLKKMAVILLKVNQKDEKADECLALANEVETALKQYAIVDHPKYGKIYAFEVDGFGNRLLMDDANVPSLLGMGYLGDVPLDDPIYQNTRRFVWSEDNPWFFRGKAGEGIGGPHIGYDMVWPMSIMMKCFTSQDDDEIRWCMRTLLNTDAGTGFIHESFHKDDAKNYTRPWFAWQNTLFGELVLKLLADGKVDLLNNL